MTGLRSRWVPAGAALLVLAGLVFLVGLVLRARDLQTAANVAQLVSIPLAAAPLVGAVVVWARRPGRDASAAPVPSTPATATATSAQVGAQLAGVHAGGNITVYAGTGYPITVPPAASDSAAGPAAPETGLGRRWWSVPPRRPGFVGRAEELAELEAALESRRRVVVAAAVTGMGGVGKTSAAIEYAHRHADEFDLAWWVPAEDPALVPERLAELALMLQLADLGDPVETALTRLRAELQERGRWLVVFDNAEDPGLVEPLIPHGPGRVLITSRNPGWSAHAASVKLGEFPRAEAITLLQQRVPGLGDSDAGQVAAAVGDLPLAVDQAAALLAETTLTVEQYLDELARRADALLAQEHWGAYRVSVAAAFSLSFDRLATEDPAALQLLTLLAWLGPEPVPNDLLTICPDGLAVIHSDSSADESESLQVLRELVSDPLALASASAALQRRALATVTTDALQVHRVPAALMRARTGGDLAPGGWATLAAGFLRAALPEEARTNPPLWPMWGRLLPHMLALTDLGRTCSPDPDDTRWLLERAATYLQTRGEPRTALPLLQRSVSDARNRLGDSHPSTLVAANNLGRVLRAMREYQRARELDEDTLARRRQVLGEEHPKTLTSANSLALDLRGLGDYERARELDEDTLARRRRTLGDEHPDTLGSANNLALDLRALKDNERARELSEDTLARRRRVLGDEHPDTLASATNLALDLWGLGDYERARELNEDTLARRRRVFGDEHPPTLASANNLALVLRELGDYERARELDEDTLARRRRTLGDEHPDTLGSANNLAIDLQELGEHEQAQRWRTWTSERHGPRA